MTDDREVEALKKADELELAWSGRFVKHYKGGIYLISHVGLMESTLEIHVVYQSLSGTWIRSLTDFLSEPSPGVKRFTFTTDKPCAD